MDIELESRGESLFRTLRQPMMPGVSHAQRPPRQRLRSNGHGFRNVWLVGSREVSIRNGGLSPRAVTTCALYQRHIESPEEDIRLLFAYPVLVFDPDAGIPRINRTLVYSGACVIAGLRLARERQVNTQVVPTQHAIEESVDLAHEIFNRVFRKVPDRVEAK